MKSILVPLVVAWLVAAVITVPLIIGFVNVLFVNVCVASVVTNVPVASGIVSVLFVLLLGLAIVNIPVPLALLSSFIDDIS